MGRDRRRRGLRPPSPIQVIGILFIFLFGAMIVYLCRYAYVNRQVMMSNSYNSRQKVLLEQNLRGRILSRDGEVLAESQLSKEGEETRVYPYGSTFAHAVGYAARGMAGVEAQANYYLIHSDISLAEKARLADAGVKKNPGNDVTTTLSVPLQQTAYEALSAYRGAIVVTDVRTGEILAMVSKPDFDPGRIDAEWESIAGDTERSRLLNRAAQGLYPPGSTFKIVTALQYIREHPEDYGDYQFVCEGSFTSGQETIHCFHGISHGRLDFPTAFQKSCNSAFADIGVGLDPESFARTLALLGFRRDFSLELPITRSRADIGADSGDAARMQLAIGQGATAMTPLHLNMITQSVANGGVMRKPYLVRAVDNAEGRSLAAVEEGESMGRVMSTAEADALTDMMVLVVNGGTARRLEGLPYQVAGKTGSAEFDAAQKSESHAWFTGFAPAEAPEIAVTVLVEQAGGGGEYAVPMARRIFEAYYERYHGTDAAPQEEAGAVASPGE